MKIREKMRQITENFFARSARGIVMRNNGEKRAEAAGSQALNEAGNRRRRERVKIERNRGISSKISRRSAANGNSNLASLDSHRFKYFTSWNAPGKRVTSVDAELEMEEGDIERRMEKEETKKRRRREEERRKHEAEWKLEATEVGKWFEGQ